MIDGRLEDMPPEVEAQLPKPTPKLEPTDDTFKDEAPWQSLIAS